MQFITHKQKTFKIECEIKAARACKCKEECQYPRQEGKGFKEPQKFFWER